MRKLTLICTTLLLTNTIFAQTLFTYGGNPVDKKEFVRVYEKNAINKAPDYSREALREYLELYSLFKMKVKEAELQKVDTTASIQYELGNYRKQLASKYLTDEEVKKQQVLEAYERMKEVVKVAHIMILSSPMAPSADTVKQYKTIDSIYNALMKGKADFAEMAKQFSEDKSSAENGGELGYITVLQTVYSFENMAYSTPVGKISKPFRTQYGYHILKVLDKKKAEGTVEVAQIMISAPKSKSAEEIEAARKKANEVAAKLKKGADFEKMVEEYSEDTYSKDQGGRLQPFGTGAYVPEFEKAAFALKKPGDISEPIKTDYGFHIIKLIKKTPVQPYDSVETMLAGKIAKDARAEIAKETFYNKIKEKNNFKEYPLNVEKLRKEFVAMIPEEGEKANTFDDQDFKGPDYTLFEIKGVSYQATDFLKHAESVTRGRVMGPKDLIYRNIYDNYVITVITDIEELNLMEENPDFKNLMTEYRDGIMLFELMDRNVWGKASKDSAGLEAYYITRKDQYTWKPGFRGTVYTFKNSATRDQAIKLIKKKNMSDEDLIKEMNTKETPGAVSIQRGYYEYEKHPEINKADVKEGEFSDGRRTEDGSLEVVYAKNIYPSGTIKTLDEARGYVIADYQDHLEKTWNAQLRGKYPVVVKEPVFDSMVKK